MDFDPADRDVDRVLRMDFWESSRHWFEGQGYFLYQTVGMKDRKYEYVQPAREYPEGRDLALEQNLIDLEDPFPYAFMCSEKATISPNRPPYSTLTILEGKVMYAQDTRGRHVVIKMVKTDSEEHKILRLLKDDPRLQDPAVFPSVIPILDLLPYAGHWFAVMPRWEWCLIQRAFFPTFDTAIQHIISLLEGLVFLQEFRIFHRDLCDRNFLVNHVSSRHPFALQSTDQHKHLLMHGVVKYAIMDFDLAMVLDERTYGANPRLPIANVLLGHESRPYETMHGYVDFDPFKYDVACLGIYFTENFHAIIVDVPLLAPLFARMITPNIEKRFTAVEALTFARTVLSTVSPPTAKIEREVQQRPRPYYEIDVWAGLSADFVKEWSSYRENPFSWSMRFQNWLFLEKLERGWKIMYYTRYTVRILRSGPHFMIRGLWNLRALFNTFNIL